MHSRSLCYSLRSDEKSRSWHYGLLGSVYASEGKVDGDEAGHRAYLYYFLRSDAKTGFRRSWLSAAHKSVAQEAPQVSKVEVLLIEDDPLWCENKKKSSNNKTVSGPRGPTSQQG